MASIRTTIQYYKVALVILVNYLVVPYGIVVDCLRRQQPVIHTKMTERIFWSYILPNQQRDKMT